MPVPFNTRVRNDCDLFVLEYVTHVLFCMIVRNACTFQYQSSNACDLFVLEYVTPVLSPVLARESVTPMMCLY